MAQQIEGYSTARPPLFNGDNFPYWKKRMEVYLRTDIEQWFSIRRGYTAPTEESGAPLDPDRWTPEMKKKVQTDSKALNTLQCGLTMEELNRVGPFDNAKELWDKLIELHEGTNDSKVTRRDLLLNSLLNIKMQDEERASQLHARIKNILNGLHLIGHQLENRDIIRYALNAFPRNTLWASIVDAYKVSKNLSKLKLDELFCELELHEQTNSKPVEKGISLLAGQTKNKEQKSRTRSQSEPESEDESESEDEGELSSEIINMLRKLIKKQGHSKEDVKKTVLEKGKQIDLSKVTCYECDQKGHYRNKCPKLKPIKKSRHKKSLKATWDDTSSEEESNAKQPKQTTFLAMTARHSEIDSESESENERSHGYESDSENQIEVNSILIDNLYSVILKLTEKLDKSKETVKSLRKVVKDLGKSTEQSSSTGQALAGTSTQFEKLEEENSNLKRQVEELSSSLERFTSGSKYLKMMLGTQRASYNRTGLGFKSNKIKSFMALTSRTSRRPVQAWVRKTNLINQVEPNQFWVPKDQVFFIKRRHRGYDPGGATRKNVVFEPA